MEEWRIPTDYCGNRVVENHHQKMKSVSLSRAGVDFNAYLKIINLILRVKSLLLKGITKYLFGKKTGSTQQR